MAVTLNRVKVAPGAVIYHGGAGAPFRAGDVVELPADHVAALLKVGHVVPESSPPGEPSPELSPELSPLA